MIYNRITKVIEEDEQYGGKYLNFLYNSFFGRVLLKIIVNPIVSKINGKYNNTSFSKNKIKKFIEKNHINIDEYEEKDYKSFNEFFIRKKKNLNYDRNKNYFISPADSKLMVYKITEDLKVKIKQSFYTLNDLIQNDTILSEYKNGNCLVFRLGFDDYHRYCYIDNGKVEETKDIKGILHTVSSISKKHKVFSQNSRVVNYLDTQNFGRLICIEVGALLVGKINNYKINEFSKGEEKGYFELGGSTIIVLTNEKIKIDSDILECSKKEIETRVKYGERIGKIEC